MPVYVPSNWVSWVTKAANGTGLPYKIVAAQISIESGFNPSAVSPAGAEGVAQFLPSTFVSYSSGSPFNPDDALRAYINFMNALLRQFNQNVFNALAAYNAGPGNIQAGFGYAQMIFNLAQTGVNVTGGTQRIPEEFALAPQAAQSTDDWSQKVRNTGDQLLAAGHAAHDASRAIERI